MSSQNNTPNSESDSLEFDFSLCHGETYNHSYRYCRLCV